MEHNLFAMDLTSPSVNPPTLSTDRTKTIRNERIVRLLLPILVRNNRRFVQKTKNPEKKEPRRGRKLYCLCNESSQQQTRVCLFLLIVVDVLDQSQATPTGCISLRRRYKTLICCLLNFSVKQKKRRTSRR